MGFEGDGKLVPVQSMREIDPRMLEQLMGRPQTPAHWSDRVGADLKEAPMSNALNEVLDECKKKADPAACMTTTEGKFKSVLEEQDKTWKKAAGAVGDMGNNEKMTGLVNGWQQNDVDLKTAFDQVPADQKVVAQATAGLYTSLKDDDPLKAALGKKLADLGLLEPMQKVMADTQTPEYKQYSETMQAMQQAGGQMWSGHSVYAQLLQMVGRYGDAAAQRAAAQKLGMEGQAIASGEAKP
jgi:hypothetical protein